MAKAIMLQGTMSNVGKSFLTAALCRIFMQDGYRCAPFKSQNMALNSFITKDGLEMGRAQAMQAEAAGTEPSVLMNPILLKPTTDVGSQVILNGRVQGNMKASEYFRNKKQFLPVIQKAYETLAQDYEIIVIEGAGSPVELNLKTDDIVNMGIAKLMNAPVLMIGDIDRGGIFAQLLGTLMLLDPDELNLVKGLIVNQFRGDKNLFQDGVTILEEKSRKSVLGVVPYLQCDIEDEDSLSHKLNGNQQAGLIDIAVIALPKLSNFTDFDVFSQYNGVSVRYVRKCTELKQPDLIFLPGTKNTISDMKWLRESGMETAILKLNQTPIFGICGGYQMMGEEISDPVQAEGGGHIRGMRLLPCRTVFCESKKQTQTKGKFLEINGYFSCLSGMEFSGYEIHMGETVHHGNALTTAGGCYAGNAAGCYIHGIFDETAERLVKELYRRKNLPFSGRVISRQEYKQQQFDLLAENVRNCLDMSKIYQILKEGV